MTSPDTPGRREQNRRRTEHALHEAALACVERDGYRGATTTRIAEAAGVSPRTFFRYFATKEEAIAPGQLRVLRRIEQLELPRGSATAAVTAVADLLENVLGAEEILPELKELPRYERILAEAPDLLSALNRQDVQISDAVAARLLTHLPGEDPLTVHLAAELVMAMWRTSWAHWRGAAVAANDPPAPGGAEGITASPANNFRACRRSLAPAIAALLGSDPLPSAEGTA